MVISSLFFKKKEVHLWQIHLNQFLPTRLFASLDSSEQQRAQQLKTEDLYRRFVVAHAAMRSILSQYLGASPGNIHLMQPARKKPSIHQAQNQMGIDFNLSHSHEMALIAVSQTFLVGIDIEHIRNMPDVTQVAKRFFTTKEYALLLQSSPQTQLALFFKIWTAKEAFLKAKGLGLSGYLDQFSIQLNTQQEPASIDMTEPDAKNWTLHRLDISSKYESTLAIKGTTESQLIYFNWDNS